MQGDRELAATQLLMSHLCHELVSPIGARLVQMNLAGLNGKGLLPKAYDEFGFDSQPQFQKITFRLTIELAGPFAVRIRAVETGGFAKSLTFYAAQGWYSSRFSSPIPELIHRDHPSFRIADRDELDVANRIEAELGKDQPRGHIISRARA